MTGLSDRILRDGALRIEGSRIVDVGNSSDLLARYADDCRLDAEGMLILPGLVSAHTHLYQVMGRGLPYLVTGVPGRWRRYAGALDYEDIRYSTLLGCIEAIRSGTTTLFDQHLSPAGIPYALDAIAEAVLQAGVRACLSYAVSDTEGALAANNAIQENIRFARRIASEPTLAAMMGLESSHSLSDETMAAAVGAAAVAGIGFHINVIRDAIDLRETEAKYSVRVIERLRRFGILGPRTLAVYCTRLLPAEIESLQRSGTWVAHCPRSSTLHGLELPPVAELLRRRVPVCLGTDTMNLDLFDEMQTAYLLHQHHPGDPRALDPAGLLRMTWEYGGALAARVFGQKLGRIERGAQADVILVRSPLAGFAEMENLASYFILGLGHAHVDTTIVAGRVLMRHSILRNLDESMIVANATERLRRLQEQLA